MCPGRRGQVCSRGEVRVSLVGQRWQLPLLTHPQAGVAEQTSSRRSMRSSGRHRLPERRFLESARSPGPASADT